MMSDRRVDWRGSSAGLISRINASSNLAAATIVVLLGATIAGAQPSTQLTITKPAQSCSDVPACAERLSDLREYREYLEDTIATCKAVNKDLAAKLRKQAEDAKPPEETTPSEPSK